tara:strand:- start:3 stop:977 length:975 start_codon:yes stop_codon:yes gene_type:complete
VLLKDIQNVIGGELINDDQTIEITGVQTLELATSENLCFIFKPSNQSVTTNAKCVVTKTKVSSFKYAQIIHPNPRLAMAQLLEHLQPTFKEPLAHHISKQAFIAKNVTCNSPLIIASNVSIGEKTRLGKNTEIHANVSIGKNCVIGEHCIIYPNVSIYDNTIIGDHTIIHSNSTVGSDGFGYEHDGKKWVKIPHISHVIIGKNVEIGSNTSIDKGCVNPTIIEDGVKIDNQVQVAHNCHISKNSIIVGGASIGGSVKVGENSIIAGDASVSDNVTIGKNVLVFAKSGVTKNIADDQQVSGFPATNHKEDVKRQVYLNRLYKSNN